MCRGVFAHLSFIDFVVLVQEGTNKIWQVSCNQLHRPLSKTSISIKFKLKLHLILVDNQYKNKDFMKMASMVSELHPTAMRGERLSYGQEG